MATYNGQLSQNKIFSAIYNMIISQTVLAPELKNGYGKLAELFREDAGLYGDSKLFYDVQIGHVEDFSGDTEAANLLGLQRPTAPYCTKVTINKFKKVWLTVDQFLTKQAFADEGTFGQFNSIILATLGDTKSVYMNKLFDVVIGTTTTTTGSQSTTVTLPAAAGTETNAEREALDRRRGGLIAKKIADVLIDAADVSTLYNDLGYERAYAPEDFVIVWNASYQTEMEYVDLPTIFHNDQLKENLNKYVLPAKYFGTVSTATSSAANARACDEMKISTTWYRPGDTVPTSSTVTAGSTYTNNAKVICKLVHKDAFKWLSGFETMTEFTNPRALNQNHYLIFGHSDPRNSRLPGYPVITIAEA